MAPSAIEKDAVFVMMRLRAIFSGKAVHRRQLVLAAVSIGLALLVLFATEWDAHQSNLENRWFLPNLRQRTSALDKVVLWSAQGKLTLVKANKRWTVLEKDSYPANLQAVVDFILPLREMKIVENKTAQPALLPQLGLDEQQGTHVILMAGDELLEDFVIGKTSRHGPGGFVRQAGEHQAYLVNKQVYAPLDPMQWIDRTVLELKPGHIQSIRLIGSTQGSAAGKSLLEEVPRQSVVEVAAGENEVGDADARNRPGEWKGGLLQTLKLLRFDDVRTRPAGPLQPRWVTEIHTTDGVTYSLEHFQQDGSWWTALHARPSADSVAGSTRDSDRRIRVLNHFWRPWLYRFPANSVWSLTLGRINPDPMVTEKPEEEKIPTKDQPFVSSATANHHSTQGEEP